MNELGAQAKYSVAKLGEPIQIHIDARHEAFAARFYGQGARAAPSRGCCT